MWRGRVDWGACVCAYAFSAASSVTVLRVGGGVGGAVFSVSGFPYAEDRRRASSSRNRPEDVDDICVDCGGWGGGCVDGWMGGEGEELGARKWSEIDLKKLKLRFTLRFKMTS